MYLPQSNCMCQCDSLTTLTCCLTHPSNNCILTAPSHHQSNRPIPLSYTANTNKTFTTITNLHQSVSLLSTEMFCKVTLWCVPLTYLTMMIVIIIIMIIWNKPWCFPKHTHTHTYTHKYTFTDPPSAQVRLKVEFIMERAELHYAIKSKQ
jgi:hypothetical protein